MSPEVNDGVCVYVCVCVCVCLGTNTLTSKIQGETAFDARTQNESQ